MCKYAILLAAALSLGFAPVPFPKPPKPDANGADTKTLQGNWLKVHSIPPGNGEGEGALVFTGQHMRYSLNGNMVGEYEFTVDARKKPKVFDFKGTGGAVVGVSYRGIYRLEKDTLTISYVMTSNERERPGDFDGTKDGVIVSVYSRQKP
jgi:uncharacterized protein (TIGR03067 family)